MSFSQHKDVPIDKSLWRKNLSRTQTGILIALCWITGVAAVCAQDPATELGQQLTAGEQASLTEDSNIPERFIHEASKEPLISLTNAEQAWLIEHPVIYVTSEVDWPPFDFVEDGEPTGFSIDYLNLVAEKAGLNFSYVTDTWPNLLQSVYDKRLDLAHTLVINPERIKYLLFTKSYIQATDALYVRDDEESKTVEEIMQKRIASGKGFASEEFLKRNYPDTEIVYVDSELEGFEAVALNKADGFISWLPTANYLLRTNLITNVIPRFRVGQNEDVAFRMAVRNDWPELVSILEKGMKQITREEYNALFDKWLIVDKLPSEQNKVILTDEEQAWLKEHPVIRVGANPGFAPLEFREESGVMQGISVDYLERIRKILGVEFEFVDEATWAEALEMARNGELDLLSSVKRTPSGEQFLSFTDSYIEIPVVIFSGPELTFVNNLDELSENRITVVKGNAIEELLTADHPDIILVPSKNTVEALHLLARGGVDVFVGDLLTTSYYLSQLGYSQIKVAGSTPYLYDQRMGVRKDWPEFAGMLQKALDSITQQERNVIKQQWIAVKYEHGFDYSLLWKTLGVITLGFGSIWILTLNRQMNQRKLTEKKIRESEERYQRFIANSHEQIWCVEFTEPIPLDLPEMEQVDHILEHGYFSEVNEAAAKEYAASVEEMNGRPLVKTFSPSLPTTIPFLRAVVRSGYRMVDVESEELATDGTRRTMLNTFIGTIEDDKVVRVWGTARDVTQQRKVEEETQHMRRALVHADRALSLGELSGSIAHELNQPLTGILSNAQSLEMLLKHDPDQDEQRNEIVEHIISDTKRAGAVIRNVQDIFRQNETPFLPLNLNDTIEEALRLLKTELVSQHVSLETDMTEPGPVVNGNKVELQQVLINLVINASQAMRNIPDAEREIRLGTDSPVEGMVGIWVEDFGPGIDPTFMPHIFDAFSTSKQSGTGLGLALCRRIIKSHAGKMWAENKPEGGARIQFTLPVSAA